MSDYTTKFQANFDLYTGLKNDIGILEENAQYIVKAVQEHDSLIAEIEKLKCMLELTTNLKQQAEAEVERLEQENEQLKLYETKLNDGTVDLIIGGKPAAIFMGTLIGFFRQNKGDNYLTLTLKDKNNNKYGISIENCNGTLSIAEKLNNQQKEIEQLREALKKCNPLAIDEFMFYQCQFCKSIFESVDDEHKPDCEYVLLCGGDKDEI